MFNTIDLTSINSTEGVPSRFWWIDRKLLSVDVSSAESLTMSAPIVLKLTSSLDAILKEISAKRDYVVSKTRDVFSYRVKLEQMQRAVKNSKMTIASVEDVDVLGFDFAACREHMRGMEQMLAYIAETVQSTPITILEGAPSLSDEDIVTGLDDLKMTVNAGKVKFFSGTSIGKVLSAVEDLISFDKSIEATVGYAQNITRDCKTFDKPIKELGVTETVDVSKIQETVDGINRRITAVNHLLNTMFLLQACDKVINVIFTDAISNLKEV